MTDLSNLKVGDVVIRYASFYGTRSWNKVTITGETKTLWKTDTGERFSKKNLFNMGREFGIYASIHPITPELEAKVAEFEATKKHQSVWNKFSQLRRPARITVERLQEIYDELKGGK